MVKLLDTPLFWSAVVLGITAYGMISMMPDGTLRRLVYQLAAHL